MELSLVYALKSPGINRKSRASYDPGSGFLSNATWPSMLKKHYDGLINHILYDKSKKIHNCLPVKHRV